MHAGLAIMTGIKKTFVFTGQASRTEFWWFAPIILALTATVFYQNSRIMGALTTLFFDYFGVLGSILVTLLLVSLPLFSALVRRYRDAGLWPIMPLMLPAYILIAPPLGIVLDMSPFGIESRTQGMPEILYVGFGYCLLLIFSLALAVKPTRVSQR